MFRIRLVLLTEALATALLLVVAHPAAAQNTVNQTTCGGVSGVGSCLTNGFLQDLTVDCANAHGTEVSTALAQITDRNGPNRITLSGGNCGGFSIVGFNRLTIVGDGSPVGGFWAFVNSRNILLKSITYDFSVQAGNLNMQGSEVTFDGVTVKNATSNAGSLAVGLVGSSLSFTGAPSLTDRQKLLDSELTYDQVAQALEANNVILPSGELATGDTVLPVETVAVYKSLDDIRNIGVFTTPAAGTPASVVRLGDIATVAEASAAPNGASRTDGQPAVSIQVTKAKDANTVQVAHRVTAELDKIKPALPQGASFSVFFDESTFITNSINGVVRDGLIGGVFAIIIVFLFLANWRTTLVTAVSIPLSVITAVVLLDRMGYSLNIMTLGGLTIAIGRVIDDSIVVLENIYRHMAKGEKTFHAIVNGAREVSIAITGATATTCAVFLPLGLVGGIIGQLFFSFALAVVFALLASLLVAVTVIPALTRFTIAGRVKVREKAGPGDTPLAKVYTPVLRWALGHRWITLGVAAALFVGSLALVPLLPVQFLPDSGLKTVTVSVNARPGETQDAVLQQAEAVEKLLSNFKVDRYQTVINGTAGDLGALSNIISGKGANSASDYRRAGEERTGQEHSCDPASQPDRAGDPRQRQHVRHRRRHAHGLVRHLDNRLGCKRCGGQRAARRGGAGAGGGGDRARHSQRQERPRHCSVHARGAGRPGEGCGSRTDGAADLQQSRQPVVQPHHHHGGPRPGAPRREPGGIRRRHHQRGDAGRAGDRPRREAGLRGEHRAGDQADDDHACRRQAGGDHHRRHHEREHGQGLARTRRRPSTS